MSPLRIPAGRLPSDPVARHAALRTYFCDKDARCQRTDAGWEIELGWTGGDGRHVDPRLAEGLADWGDIAEDAMWKARRSSGRTLTALYDSWTLLAWSEWLASDAGAHCDAITLLHVDDHRDLGSPRLFQDESGWTDPFTGKRFALGEPASVESAIASGAIGMGSFMTPVLHRFPQATVRQLTQPPKAPDTRDYSVMAELIPDDLIDPGQLRPAIALVEQEKAGAEAAYRITPDFDAWVSDLPDTPILLHIDMDYFSNRYDGDGDWQSHEGLLDPPLHEILARIDAIAAAMRNAGLTSRIASSSVAFSPGFFPAEHWQAADLTLRQALPELYG